MTEHYIASITSSSLILRNSLELATWTLTFATITHTKTIYKKQISGQSQQKNVFCMEIL